mgnify:FL=1
MYMNNAYGYKKRHTGFTIVELLIVIVIIGILAAISIVAYSGIQNKANDATVQQDLVNIAKKLELYRASHDQYPAGSAQLAEAQITASKQAYGRHYIYSGGSFNLLYCYPSSGAKDKFALVASSKSGNMFQYTSERGAGTYAGGWSGSDPVCAQAGVSSAARDWFYEGSAWRSYIR